MCAMQGLNEGRWGERGRAPRGCAHLEGVVRRLGPVVGGDWGSRARERFGKHTVPCAFESRGGRCAGGDADADAER